MVGLAILAGLVVRIILIKTSIGVMDSDEAVVGLMARHFDSGSFRAFFWGQNYGGTIETAVTAAVFWLFGSSAAALKAVPMALDAVAAILVWRIGRRLMSRSGALVAALLLWLWPANFVWWSIKARGFYEATLCLTLACALLVLRIGQDERGDSWWNWSLIGLLAGLGWWQTPQAAYILIPAGLWLLVVRRGAVAKAVAAIPGLVLGALPWLVANISSGFASLTPPPAVVKGTYVDHLLTFVRLGLPMTFGLKQVYLPFYVGAAHLSALLYAAGVGLVVAGCLRRQRGSVFLGLIVVSYPFLHAVLTLSGEVAEGRYTLLLLPWLALAMARACQPRVAAAALTVVVLAVSFVGLRDLRGQTSPYAPDHHVPTSLASLEHSLTAHGVDRMWANYWVAYRVTFDTHERIIAASALNPRYLPYNSAVVDAHDPAWVVLSASRDVRRLRGWLVGREVRFDSWTVGTTWTVFIPHARIFPWNVGNVSL